MSSTCFEPDGSSSGRWLYLQVWYNLFICQWYRQSCRWQTVFGTLHNTMYSSLPEEEPSGSKHVENTAKIKSLIWQGWILFVYITRLYYNAQCKIHRTNQLNLVPHEKLHPFCISIQFVSWNLSHYFLHLLSQNISIEKKSENYGWLLL